VKPLRGKGGEKEDHPRFGKTQEPKSRVKARVMEGRLMYFVPAEGNCHLRGPPHPQRFWGEKNRKTRSLSETGIKKKSTPVT